MNIFPMNREGADRRHWVVRCLRFYGYLIATFGLIAGFFVGSETVAQQLLQGTDWPRLLVVALSTLVCGLIGLALGLFASLPAWAISLVLDDMHAMRQYMQGFVVMGGKQDIEK